MDLAQRRDDAIDAGLPGMAQDASRFPPKVIVAAHVVRRAIADIRSVA